MTWLQPPGVTGLEVWDLPSARGPLHTLKDADWEVEVVRAAYPADCVWVGGGRAPDCSPAPDRIIDQAGRFAFEQGALDWLRQRQLSTATVADLGQTGLKITRLCGESVTRRVVERPADPMTALLESVPPGPLLLGLPAELDARLVPGPCTYEFPPDFIARLALKRAPIWVCNDAVLATLTAGLALSARGFSGRALVITLGYGVGAARMEC